MGHASTTEYLCNWYIQNLLNKRLLYVTISTHFNAKWAAFQDKNFRRGNSTKRNNLHWILTAFLVICMSSFNLVVFPSHTVLKELVSHQSLWQSHITDQCNLFIDFWIPNSPEESHRSTTCGENMAGKHVNTDVPWQLLMAATQNISQSTLLPLGATVLLNMINVFLQGWGVGKGTDNQSRTTDLVAREF